MLYSFLDAYKAVLHPDFTNVNAYLEILSTTFTHGVLSAATHVYYNTAPARIKWRVYQLDSDVKTRHFALFRETAKYGK